MKRTIFSLMAATAFLFSCGGGETSDAAGTTEKAADSKIDMDGPAFEIVVNSFSLESMKTEIHIVNRTGEAINSISGRLVFLGEDGEQLTTATGRPLDSPFNYSENPHVVAPRSMRSLELRNKLPDAVASITVADISAKTASGENVAL